MTVMAYVYLGPIVVAAGVASVCVNIALATPLLPVFMGMYIYYRSKDDTDSDKFWGSAWLVLRMYFLGLCILVYFAPALCIVAAAAACVVIIQIFLLPRTYMMHRDLDSWDFFKDDCQSMFELLLHVFGTIPSVVIACATFPLVGALFVIHQADQVRHVLVIFLAMDF